MIEDNKIIEKEDIDDNNINMRDVYSSDSSVYGADIDEEENNYDIDDIEDDDPTSYEEYQKIYEEKKKKKEMLEKIRIEEEKIERENRKAWTRKNKKSILIGSLIILTFIFFVVIYLVNKSLIQVNYTKDELIGENYTVVEDKLESQGFKNIEIKEIKDLTLEEREKSEKVTEVIIGNKNNFRNKSKFFPNDKVIIIYHSTIKITPPITSKKAKGKQYKDILKQFKNSGFTNVKTEKIEDLVTGWLTKDGEVEEIKINANKDFKTTDEFEEDVEVIIKYHTFKKK